MTRNHGHRWALPVGLTLLVASGCHLMTTPDNPQTINANSLGGPAAYEARLVGTTSDFGASLDDAATYGGLFTDELEWGGSFVARQDIDLRNVKSNNDIVASEPYTALQTAAKTSKDLLADMMAGKFGDQLPDPKNSADLARVALFAGYSRLYLADLFCTLAFDNTGPEYTSAEVYKMAEDYFTQALQASNATSDVKNAAHVGRARARLDMGDSTGALSDAQAVPQGFEYIVHYSGVTTREENLVNGLTWLAERLSVAPTFQDLTIDSTAQPDPRVQVSPTGGTGFNGGVLQNNPVKYNARTSPIRLASWAEAQYMIAEIQGGDVARQIIDDVRASQGISETWDASHTATDAQIRSKVIDERSRTLFLEGQRMGDLRRYKAAIGLDLFPTGSGYGSETCMPLPDLERDNNPGL